MLLRFSGHTLNRHSYLVCRRLGRELEKYPAKSTSDKRWNLEQRMNSFESKVSQIFRRSSVQPSASVYTINASFTSTVSNVITTSTSTAAQQRPSNSTNSTLTPHFWLSYHFNNSRAGLGKTPARKAKQKVIKYLVVRSLTPQCA